jgi:nitroreductase
VNVSAAVATRKSIRAFLQRSIPISVVKEILERAAHAPSGSNLQPWHVRVLMGRPRDELVRRVHSKMLELPSGETPEYPIHPPNMSETYGARYARAAALMYGAAGVSRDDVLARRRHLANNWSFFGAPVGLIFTIDRQMGPGQWMDLGMYLQTVMLLARDFELDTCAQEAWAVWPGLLRECLALPQNEMVVCGMALGYADHGEPINGFTSERAPFHEHGTFVESIPPQ